MFWVFSMLSKTLHSEKALLQINFVLRLILFHNERVDLSISFCEIFLCEITVIQFF